MDARRKSDQPGDEEAADNQFQSLFSWMPAVNSGNIFVYQQSDGVSILVLMDARRKSLCAIKGKFILSSFNPCSHGCPP